MANMILESSFTADFFQESLHRASVWISLARARQVFGEAG